jgi:hypothetical protein
LDNSKARHYLHCNIAKVTLPLFSIIFFFLFSAARNPRFCTGSQPLLLGGLEGHHVMAFSLWIISIVVYALPSMVTPLPFPRVLSVTPETNRSDVPVPVGWSKEAILALVGVFVACTGILIGLVWPKVQKSTRTSSCIRINKPLDKYD